MPTPHLNIGLRVIEKIKKFSFFNNNPWAVYCEGPPSFIWKGGGEPKIEALLFQSTVDIHFQNAHKTLFQSTVYIHFQNAHKTQKTVKASTHASCIIKYLWEEDVKHCFSLIKFYYPLLS